MYKYKINKIGENFIEKIKKETRRIIYVLPPLLAFLTISGFVKLGFSAFSILAIILTYPVLIIGFFTGVIKPRKIIKNLVNVVESNPNGLTFYSEKGAINSNRIERKRHLQVFQSSFNYYFVFTIGKDKYYLIPEFFDDFKLFEDRIKVN